MASRFAKLVVKGPALTPWRHVSDFIVLCFFKLLSYQVLSGIVARIAATASLFQAWEALKRLHGTYSICGRQSPKRKRFTILSSCTVWFEKNVMMHRNIGVSFESANYFVFRHLRFSFGASWL